MLSGTLSTSCMTTPHSSRRFCSLFSFFAYTTPATSVRHVAASKYFFITTSTVKTSTAYDLLQNRSFTEGLSKTLTSREGDALPDSQAGHFCDWKQEVFLTPKTSKAVPPANASILLCCMYRSLADRICLEVLRPARKSFWFSPTTTS